MEKAVNERTIREYQRVLDTRPAEVFPLLCPVREYDWIPLWHCEMVYSRSGFAELGCVFRTDFGDQWGPETWVVSHYRPAEKIAFVRTGALRTTRYEIFLAAESQNTTRISWRQELTGLNPEGNRLLGAPSGDSFRKMMVDLNDMLAHYLATGTALAPAVSAGLQREQSAR